MIQIKNNVKPLQQYFIDKGINAYIDGKFDQFETPCVEISADINLMHIGLNAYDNTITVDMVYGEDNEDFTNTAYELLEKYVPITETDLWQYTSESPTTDSETNTMRQSIIIQEILQWR